MGIKFCEFRGAWFHSAVDDFDVRRYGPDAEAIPASELREGLAYAKADTWSDGEQARHKVDGRDVFIRRSGWRFQVWDANAEAPAPDPAPMPEGAEPLDAEGRFPERPRQTLRIAPVCGDGSPWPPRPKADSEAAAALSHLLDAHSKAKAAGLDDVAESVLAQIRALSPPKPAP